jgi:hypothetical protein
MAGNNLTFVIDQNRIDETELGNAVGNLADLLSRMRSRVVAVGHELVDCNEFNLWAGIK